MTGVAAGIAAPHRPPFSSSNDKALQPHTGPAKTWTTDTVRCRFRRLRETLGLYGGVIPYGTRHRLASDMINQQKADSVIVARLLGHTDVRMLVKTYFREDADATVEVMKKAAVKETSLRE
jgi:integrase